MTNRITNKPVENMTTNEAATQPVVRARWSLHWTCPDCNCTQISERSETHTEACNRCGKSFCIDVKART